MYPASDPGEQTGPHDTPSVPDGVRDASAHTDPARSATPDALDAPDAALAAAVVDEEGATLDLDELAEASAAPRSLLDALERAGLLIADHVDEAGRTRYAASDVHAVRAGLTLLDAGLPLAELLDLGRRTDAAIRTVAEQAVDAFLRFVRDPVRGTASSDDEAADRLVTAYDQMLPATERLVAHHLRRRLMTEATERVARELGALTGDAGGPDDADAGSPSDADAGSSGDAGSNDPIDAGPGADEAAGDGEASAGADA